MLDHSFYTTYLAQCAECVSYLSCLERSKCLGVAFGTYKMIGQRPVNCVPQAGQLWDSTGLAYALQASEEMMWSPEAQLGWHLLIN